MRIVGPRKSEPDYEPDVERAWRRAMALDAQLKGTLPPHPRGIFRGSQAWFNAMDEARAAEIARRVNAP